MTKLLKTLGFGNPISPLATLAFVLVTMIHKCSCESLWPPIRCHKFYNNSVQTLPEINEKCRDGTRYREVEVKRGDGRHVISDRKGCIAVSLGILYLMHGHGKSVFYDYNVQKAGGFWYSMQNMFGGVPETKDGRKEEQKKRKEFVENLLEKGKTCRLSKEQGSRASSEYWSEFYGCIERVWACPAK